MYQVKSHGNLRERLPRMLQPLTSISIKLIVYLTNSAAKRDQVTKLKLLVSRIKLKPFQMNHHRRTTKTQTQTNLRKVTNQVKIQKLQSWTITMMKTLKKRLMKISQKLTLILMLVDFREHLIQDRAMVLLSVNLWVLIRVLIHLHWKIMI